MTINVVVPNNPPSGADKTIAMAEDGTYALTATDFGFTDPNDLPADGFAAVKITTLAGLGTVKLSGTAVTVGQTFRPLRVPGT